MPKGKKSVRCLEPGSKHLLLSSCSLLTTINPQLSMLSLEPTKPTHGVYLINAKGEKDYVPQSTPKIVFDAKNIEFLSTKDELTAVYSYDQENYGGTDEIKYPNLKTSQKESFGGSFRGKSIYFLWNKPGVYLYPKTNFLGRPIYINSSISSLSNYDFDNKVQSIKFINDPDKKISYGIVLFTDNDFRGSTCGYAYGDIEDLSKPSSAYREFDNPIGFNVSSFSLLNKTEEQTGEVTFYDSINCDYSILPPSTILPSSVTCKWTVDSIKELRYFYDLNFNIIGKNFTCSDGSEKPVDKNILSFEINGNFGVVLNTQPKLAGRCELFTKPPGTTCVSTLKGEYVYSSGPDGNKVRSLIIIPLAQ